MIPYPEIDPIALQLGPLAVRWYGLMYLLGFLGGWWFARKRAAQPGAICTPAQVEDLAFYTALGVILGGRLGYVLFYGFAELVADPASIFRIWEGGMSFHGGLIGVFIGFWLFGRKVGASFFQVSDFSAPMVPIGLGAGRIGNFINGELWGKPTDVPWSFAVNGQAVHASQLYEFLLEGVLLFAILWIFSAKPRPTRAVSGLFLLSYGIFRFGVEFVRVPDAHLGYLAFDWLTMGQALSLPMIVFGILFLAQAYRGQGILARQTG